MGRTDQMSSAERFCAQTAEKMGIELVDISVDREPGGRYLRIYIDRPEGITLDDCEAFHKAVRPAMESVDYDFMEVSSPGLDRPLKKDRDFERHIGDEIEIRLFRPMDGAKVLTGILTGFDRDEITIERGGEETAVPRKAAALVKPVIDMEGIEEVDLSGEETEET